VEIATAGGYVVTSRLEFESVRIKVEHAEPRAAAKLAGLSDAAWVDDVPFFSAQREAFVPLLLPFGLRPDHQRAMRVAEDEDAGARIVAFNLSELVHSLVHARRVPLRIVQRSVGHEQTSGSLGACRQGFEVRACVGA
jgi:hypothetical protein